MRRICFLYHREYQDKLAVVLSSAKALNILTDGSEARKTGMERELVHVIRGGIPVYFCAALQDCNKYGGTDADSLKLAIDTAFDKDNGSIKISEDTFLKRMVSSTADGASVNFGRYNGVLTQQKETRHG